jgi:hypothetical protein
MDASDLEAVILSEAQNPCILLEATQTFAIFTMHAQKWNTKNKCANS